MNARRFNIFFNRLEAGLVALLGLRGNDRRRSDRGADRRTRPRVMSRNLIRVVRSDGIPQNQVFNLLDISETGFKFAGLKHLMPGSHLEVVVNIREFNRQIPMDARIIWSEPISMKVVWTQQMMGHTHMRQTGAQIVAMAETDRYALKDFVEHKIQDLHLAH
ncbi:MAG: PilZ domain-containing protein [Candidatus Omnitrophica bacterium]|nr:PilZ domain-containing protein [Candidatus Omnitrophota bacterium]